MTARVLLTAGLLFSLPVLHPILQPLMQDGTHLLWIIHPIAVAMLIFNGGVRWVAPALIGSVAMIAVVQAVLDIGGGSVGAVIPLAVAIGVLNAFAAGFALYTRTGQDRYSNLFEHTNDAIFVHALDGRLVDVNPRAEALLDFTRAELLSMSVPDILLPEERSAFAEANRQMGQSGEFTVRTRLLSKHGRVIPIEVCGLRFESEGTPLVQALVQDLTAQQQDRRLQELLTMAIEQTAESVHIADVAGKLVYANTAFEQLTGISAAESVGTRVRVLETDDDPEFSEILHGALARGEVWSGTLSRVTHDGRPYDVEVSFSPMRDDHGKLTHVVIVQRDVTKVRQLEERLIASKKLETVGTLAGGIAHDFNNLLTPILGYADLALDDLPEDLPLRDDIERIAQAARRGKSLVEQILAFSRPSEAQQKPVSVKRVIGEALNLLSPTLPAHVELKTEIGALNPHILGDATQIHQVVVNLCSNAVQAMGSTGGTLQIELETVDFDGAANPNDRPLPAGEYMVLTVSDTGVGMDHDTIGRIFEPFFTTKQPGQGTGLGMSVVHGVVTAHGGDLTVESTEGSGTRICVYLPVYDGPLEDEAVVGAAASSSAARILVVDDEVEIGRLMKKVLERAGHDVTVEARSTNALVRISQTPNAFDLLITDQSMPEMTGGELASKALAIRPDLPIVMITGYSESLNAERAHAMGIRDYLFKPVRPSELRSAITAVLADSGAPAPATGAPTA